MKAYGLEDMNYAKGLDDQGAAGRHHQLDRPRQHADRQALPRLRQGLRLRRPGTAATQATSATTGTTAKYVEQSLEDNQGKQNEGVQLALYFTRNASSITNVYGLLADTNMLKVVQTAFGLPASASADIDAEAATLSKLVSVSDLQDPAKVQKIAERFTAMWDLGGNNTSSDAANVTQIFAALVVVRLQQRPPAQPPGPEARRRLSHAHQPLRLHVRPDGAGEAPRHRRLQHRQHEHRRLPRRGRVLLLRPLQGRRAPAAYVSTGTDYVSRAAGSVTKTDNPLDVAIQGDAFFAVKTPDGTAYTRDGRMQMTPGGELQTMNGYPVLDAGGATMLLNTDAGPPMIAADGMMTQNGQQVGAIGLFSLPADATLTRYDNSAVFTDKAAVPVLDFSGNNVAQGFSEGSNVNPVLEMTKLIEIQRAFDGLASTTQSSEGSLTDAIKTLGSPS